MLEKYRPKRGEVYYARYNNSFGAEEAVGRPIVVVNSTVGNDSAGTVVGLFMTTSPQSGSVSVPITSAPRKSWVLCNQIGTFDIRRLGDRMCTLSLNEMAQIDACLSLALGLDERDPDVAEKEKALRFEIASLKNHINQISANYEKKLAEKKAVNPVENDLYKKLYKKALEMLVECRFERDLQRASQIPVPMEPETPVPEELPEVTEPVVVVPETPAEEPEQETEEKVNINTCTEKELREIGFKPSVAAMIVLRRPFVRIEALKAVPGVTRIAYQLVQNKITVGDTTGIHKEVVRPVVSEELPDLSKPEPKKKPKKKAAEKKPAKKVNVNTAEEFELSRVGMGDRTARSIRAYRGKHGPFKSLEDLLQVPRFGVICLKKYGPMLEV